MLIRIGDVEVWRILEMEIAMAPLTVAFPDLEGDDDAQALFRALDPLQVEDETGMWRFPVQGFLLKTPDHVILVDACVGNHKTVGRPDAWHQREDDRFLASLKAAGLSPEDVDYVLCTHLHVDHVGWNTKLLDGRWVPTFANARYLLPDADNTHYRGTDDTPPSNVYTESVAPVIAAGQAELVSGDHPLGDHVTLVPTPGHTPGHVAVRIHSAGAEALITGDVIHSSAQCARPDWKFAWDTDQDMAVDSRLKFLNLAAESGATVLGSHFSLPSIGTVSAQGNAFKWTDR